MSTYEPIYEYDSNGNIIYGKHNDGYEYWNKYDSNGKCIHFWNNQGYESWYEYDSNGNQIHYRNSDGLERWFWDGRATKDPIKILILETQLHSKVPQ